MFVRRIGADRRRQARMGINIEVFLSQKCISNALRVFRVFSPHWDEHGYFHAVKLDTIEVSENLPFTNRDLLSPAQREYEGLST